MKENMSLYKAFAIIECLSKSDEMSILKLSKELDLNKSTVYRFLSTLSSLGYVKQNPSNRNYSLTFKFFQLGRAKSSSQSLSSQVRPYMEKLREKTDESVNLAIMDGSNVLYIDQVESSNTIRANVEVGKTFPAYSVGVGKAIMAYLPEEEIIRLFGKVSFVHYTDKTVSSLGQLLKELENVRRCGYALDDEECMEGLACIATPVFSSDVPVAAISVTFPRFRYQAGSEQEKRLIDLLMEMAGSVNELL